MSERQGRYSQSILGWFDSIADLFMKDILSGLTEEELQKIITQTDLTMNEVIREKLNAKKLKN